jgi:conjugative transfer pilus assembly protein TraH
VIQSGSIIDSFNRGVALTSTQQAFVASLGVNMQKMMMNLSSMNPNDAMQIYNQLVDVTADQVTASVAYTIISAVQQAYNPTTQASHSIDNTMKRNVPMSSAQNVAFEKFERDSAEHNDFEERAHRVMMIIAELKELRAENSGFANTR